MHFRPHGRSLKVLTATVATLATAAVWSQAGAASVLTVDLGSSGGFAILAGSGITIAAPPGTVITGDIGSAPTPAITGLENAVINGVNQAGNAVTLSAKTDLMLAYIDAAGRSADFSYGDAFDLSGTLIGGVHSSAGSFLINTTLTLDAGGDSSMVWIFQTASTLEAASGSQIILANGALASNVFWQVGSSATLNTSADFAGSILADTSITLNAGVNLDGRALAINGAVTLGSTTITVPVPEPSAPAILGAAAVCLLAGNRRRQTS